MALVDRLSRPLPPVDPDTPPTPDPPGGYLSNHAFSASVYLWGQGIATRVQVVTKLGLLPEDEIQLDQMAAHYASLTTAKKDAFHGKLEALGVLLEGNYITPAFYKTQLGLT